MIRNLARSLVLFMLVPTMALAQLESTLNFNGQNAEVLKAEKQISVVVPRQVEIPSTCSRQVPTGMERVCHDETRYRQECSWVPSSQRCWDDTDRVCHSVPRTRQECHNGPSRRVCSDRPDRQVCTPRPDREVCTSRPDREVCHDKPEREVCTDRPEREVCTTRPDGRRHCTTVGGGRHCTTVGGGRECRTVDGGQDCRRVDGGEDCRTVDGGQECHDVPGERECRMVSYNDTECEDVSRRRCETVPGRNDCESIPYEEEVCGMEMQYRTESYACTETRTVNETIVKTIKSEVNVQIITNGLVEEFPLLVSVKEESSSLKKFSIEAKLLKEPTVFVVLSKKEIVEVKEVEKEILVKSKLVLEVLTKEMLPIAFPSGVSSASISSETKKLTIVFEGPISSQGEVDLLITHKAFLSRLKTIAEFKGAYPSEKVELGVAEEKAALNIDLTDAIVNELKSRNMKLKLNLSSQLSLQGELMNTARPETTKLFEGTFVQLN